MSFGIFYFRITEFASNSTLKEIKKISVSLALSHPAKYGTDLVCYIHTTSHLSYV